MLLFKASIIKDLVMDPMRWESGLSCRPWRVQQMLALGCQSQHCCRDLHRLLERLKPLCQVANGHSRMRIAMAQGCM